MSEIKTNFTEAFEALWDDSSDILAVTWVASGVLALGGVGSVATAVFWSLTALFAGDLSGRIASLSEYSWALLFSLCLIRLVGMVVFPYGFIMLAAFMARVGQYMLSHNMHKVTNHPKEVLADVVPLGKAKEKIAELVAYLRNPEPFIRIGAKPPRGVLLIGPPGTGKTLLAKALSNEIGPYTSFIQTTGSQIKSKWVGESAERVRALFEEAKENAKAEQERLERDCIDNPELSRYRGYCVIFIDEIDSFGSREKADFRGQSAMLQDTVNTINEMLAQMDGFETSDSVLVIGTTNDASRLDPTLLSRFPCKITTELPNHSERADIFEKQLRGVCLIGDIDLGELATKTASLSGRDIKHITEAALWSAATRNASGIDQAELLRAIDEFMESRPLSLDILDKELAFS